MSASVCVCVYGGAGVGGWFEREGVGGRQAGTEQLQAHAAGYTLAAILC